jgi:hypothetical protein
VVPFYQPPGREYIENHRDEINAGVRAALAQLDGTKGGVVSMLTGLDAAKLNGGYATHFGLTTAKAQVDSRNGR